MKADYIFLRDHDFDLCITRRKDSVTEKYKTVENKNILIVKTEIEGWYLAGLDETASKELGIQYLENTDEITKEHFNSKIPKRFGSRVDFLQEILKRFSVDTALQRNKSFYYFARKRL